MQLNPRPFVSLVYIFIPRIVGVRPHQYTWQWAVTGNTGNATDAPVQPKEVISADDPLSTL